MFLYLSGANNFTNLQLIKLKKNIRCTVKLELLRPVGRSTLCLVGNPALHMMTLVFYESTHWKVLLTVEEDKYYSSIHDVK